MNVNVKALKIVEVPDLTEVSQQHCHPVHPVSLGGTGRAVGVAQPGLPRPQVIQTGPPETGGQGQIVFIPGPGCLRQQTYQTLLKQGYTLLIITAREAVAPKVTLTPGIEDRPILMVPGHLSLQCQGARQKVTWCSRQE